jgi:hypothetical protein
MKPSEALYILDALRPESGVVRDRYLGKDPERFVLIFQGMPENWSVGWSIGQTLYHFRWVKIVGQDGSWGAVDTSLPYAIPDEKIRQDVALYFLSKLLLHPAEYANVLRGKTEILLFGVENQNLYNEAQQLYRIQPSFLQHQVKRAHAIAENLLREMERHGEVFSALICCGDLPDLVSEELERRGVSYAIIRPKISYPSDKKLYQGRLTGKLKRPSLKEVVEEKPVGIEVPPEPGEFPDKKAEEAKEKTRLSLISLITSGDILPKLQPLLSSAGYEGIEHIVNSPDYGPKTKAVLVKAKVLSLLEGQTGFSIAAFKYKLDNILRTIGIVGFLAGLAGTLFGVGAQSWFFISAIALFGVFSIIKLVLRRFADASGWLLILLGFLAGYYLWQRWGMSLGMIVGALVWRFIIPEQKIPPKEYELLNNWATISNIFMGKSG